MDTMIHHLYSTDLFGISDTSPTALHLTMYYYDIDSSKSVRSSNLIRIYYYCCYLSRLAK